MTVAVPERGERIYDTYNTRYIPPPGPPEGPDMGGPDPYTVPRNMRPPAGPRWVNAMYQRSPGELRQVPVPRPLPGFLGNRSLVIGMWLTAMLIIGFDEWHNYGVLPRPARLWYTSLVYGILAMAGTAEALVPITNAMATGYTLVLAYQYYGGSGQFAGSGAPGKPSGKAAQSAQPVTGGIFGAIQNAIDNTKTTTGGVFGAIQKVINGK